MKFWISKDFREEFHWTNKGIHVLENLNFASPFRDWDDGDYTIEEFKERARGFVIAPVDKYTQEMAIL